MLMYELIEKKRDKFNLTESEINFIIKNYTEGIIPDYQMASLLMAIYLNGMDFSETTYLTQAMQNSGDIIDYKDSGKFFVDKHSTGGVGDKLSLILAPIVASLDIHIPMIAGRGLGHTGGTLDKLESIPGFSVQLDISAFKRQVIKNNLAIIGQTSQLAPADKKIYALRDVTATVSSIPLITASIMSKKLAEGINGLVMDVKYGNGAFMKSIDDAINLAQSIVEIGKLAGKKVIAFITNMNQPIGTHVGNWLEIIETVQCLSGKGPKDTMALNNVLAGAMIHMAGKCDSLERGIELAERQIENGMAYKKFCEIVSLQGGDVSFIENPNLYPKASTELIIRAKEHGFISEINALNIGLLGVKIKAGREKITDLIDFTAGFVFHKKVGDTILKDEIIAEVHLGEGYNSEEIENQFNQCIVIKDQAPVLESNISCFIDEKGIIHQWVSLEVEKIK